MHECYFLNFKLCFFSKTSPRKSLPASVQPVEHPTNFDFDDAVRSHSQDEQRRKISRWCHFDPLQEKDGARGARGVRNKIQSAQGPLTALGVKPGLVVSGHRARKIKISRRAVQSHARNVQPHKNIGCVARKKRRQLLNKYDHPRQRQSPTRYTAWKRLPLQRSSLPHASFSSRSWCLYPNAKPDSL